jgi:hypothetical protein
MTVVKKSPFHEAKPRTPKGEARLREIEAQNLIQEMIDVCDEDQFKEILAKRFGIAPGHPRYGKVMATWKQVRSERL